jgi:hypothetical protein
MKSRFAAVLASLALLLGGTAALAQATSDAELTRDELQLERKRIVAENLQLSEPEAAAFWPVYDKYAAEQRAVNDDLIATLDAFSKEYDTLSDARAKELLAESLAYREDRNDLKKRWMKRFSKVLPGKQLARFYQVDNKLDTLLDALLAASVPLVK